MKKSYLDTNVFVYPILFDDKKAEAYRKILTKIVTGELSAVTSVLTWDELVYVCSKTLGADLGVMEGQKFLRFPNLEFLGVDSKVIGRAQEIVTGYGLLPRDGIHAATAIVYGIAEFVSDDTDFDKVKELNRISYTT